MSMILKKLHGTNSAELLLLTLILHRMISAFQKIQHLNSVFYNIPAHYLTRQGFL